jgi:hypothetical protein
MALCVPLAGAACSVAAPLTFNNLSQQGNGHGDGGANGGGGNSSGGGLAPGLGGNVVDDAGTSSGPALLSDGGIACPTGLQCNVACSGGGTTTITGKVYDPAGKNPLYNVAVYVPAVPLVPLPKGVPTGADACSCGALFQSGAITNTTTAVDGSFTLTNVPVGSQVPLVIQIGKWRRQYMVPVTQCTANAQPNLAFLGTIPAGDTIDNMPDIAVSTGGADTLECLMLRIGVPASEYVGGAATTGHIHVFNGGGATGGGPERNQMATATPSSTTLWDSQAHLMPYDIVLLSCEGEETYDAVPANLETYLNVGGRAFASHFHYSWFSGPIDGTSAQTYTANSDWGNLAAWTADQGGDGAGPIGGIIDTTLNGSTKPFSKGVTLASWLGENAALGTDGVAAGELAIYQPRFNATVSAADTPSQQWITADSASGASGNTMYFSFDTPVNAPIGDAGVPNYCGRAVFSDLHVSGNPTTKDTGNSNGGQPPPTGCDNTTLSPQEKALEFMLFDLSSCVLPDTIAVPVDAGLPPPPPQAK